MMCYVSSRVSTLFTESLINLRLRAKDTPALRRFARTQRDMRAFLPAAIYLTFRLLCPTEN